MPLQVIDKITKVVPGLIKPQMAKQLNDLEKLNTRVKDMTNMFGHFTRNAWVYKNDKIYEFLEKMTPEESVTFYIDPKKYDWPRYLYKFGYGLEYFINKQDIHDISADNSYPLLNKMKYRRFDTERRLLLDNQLINLDLEQIRVKIIDSLEEKERSEASKFLSKNLNSNSNYSL